MVLSVTILLRREIVSPKKERHSKNSQISKNDPLANLPCVDTGGHPPQQSHGAPSTLLDLLPPSKMSQPETKKIRSSPPDVIVAVGRDDKMQEFECYRIALSFASPYFDAMLSADMAENNNSRIELPDKDPGEWKLFYKFIDPNKIATATPEVVINEETAIVLTKWFHEFQMEKYLSECDEVLRKKVSSLAWLGEETTKSAFKAIVELLKIACVYDLDGTMCAARGIITLMLVNFHPNPTQSTIRLETVGLFDLPIIREIVDLFLPLKMEMVQMGNNEEGGGDNNNEGNGPGPRRLESNGNSNVLWRELQMLGFVDSCLGGLSLDEINNNPMLPNLILGFIQKETLKKEAFDESKHTELRLGVSNAIQEMQGVLPCSLLEKLNSCLP